MALPMPDDMIPPFLAVDDEPFTMEELDLVLDEHEVQPEHVTGWTVTDVGSAEWAMANVARLDANAKLLDEQTAAYMRRIRDYHERVAMRTARRRAFFTQRLEAFAADYRALDPRNNKTLDLPSGQVKSSDIKPKALVADDAAVAEWAETRLAAEVLDKLVKRTTKTMVVELRKLVKVAEFQVGVDAVLECGHRVRLEMADENGEPVQQFEQLGCVDCDADPIDGFPTRAVVGNEPVTELRVVGADGMPVPGTTVDPGGLSFSVKPS